MPEEPEEMTTLTGEFVQSISELALWVSDLDRSIAFYRDCLGFTLFDKTEGVNAFLRSGEIVLALFLPVIEGNTAMSQQYLKKYGGPRGSVYHIGLRVNPQHLDQHGNDLRRCGVDVQVPIDFPTGRRSYFLEDPDEHFIELTDR